ncbi:MAG TPA: methyltransferase domain-containing protein [Hyphomicrobiaceae bacterium]|nr:methyltransferase domain-containing protein [Hyphomicrobiaceae bacterium]
MSEPLYDSIGAGYQRQRVPDPRIAALILAALGDARSVLNVGAGTGSYEPTDREVLAVEPSRLMISQRPGGAAPCLVGSAEALPVTDQSVDAAMAILTMHHWSNWRRGVAELRRVARRRVVILTFDPTGPWFWLTEYMPFIAEDDRRIMPPLAEIAEALGGAVITPVPVPHDCIDGFLGAYWRRPEAYLDPAVRGSISSFSKFDASAGLARLDADLASGAWRARHGALTRRESLDIGYRLIRAELA